LQKFLMAVTFFALIVIGFTLMNSKNSFFGKTESRKKINMAPVKTLAENISIYNNEREMEPTTDLFNHIDEDGDGILSPSEGPASGDSSPFGEMFREKDLDHDGSVTREEYDAL
jgi:hypothetical protein